MPNWAPQRNRGSDDSDDDDRAPKESFFPNWLTISECQGRHFPEPGWVLSERSMKTVRKHWGTGILWNS